MEISFRVKCPCCYKDVIVDTNGKYKEGMNVRETICPSCEKEFSVVSFVESVRDVTHSDEVIGILKSRLRRAKLKRIREVERIEGKLEDERRKE